MRRGEVKCDFRTMMRDGWVADLLISLSTKLLH